MPRNALPLALGVLVLASCPRPACAFERQWHAGVDAGYASLFSQPSKSGFGGGAHLAYGLSDAFNALLEADVTRHFGGSLPDKPSAEDRSIDRRGRTVWSGALGLAYTLDVARVVPYAGALAGVYAIAGGDHVVVAPGGQLALGLDYQLERNWALGAQFRMHALLNDGVQSYATVFLRAEYIWGF
jgi:hypothetical protein